MSSISHPPTEAAPTKRSFVQLRVAEMWAALAIIVMWLSVLVDAIFGPDIVTHDVSGSSATIPSAVAVALFAFLGTWVVARYGFGRRSESESA